MITPPPLIELEGPPADRGRAHGRAAGERIAKGIAHYRDQLAAQGFTDAAIAQAAEKLLPRIKAFDSSFIPELKGIAEGAEQPFEHILLLNARTEMLQIARREAARRVQTGPDVPDGCTGIVVLPEASADGQLIHAQNWDWKAECAETAVVLKVHAHQDDPGADFLTFTEAGALGRSGLNSEGIAITANALDSDRDGMHIGVPLALIRRKVLMQRHLALAMRAVYVTPKSSSNNMMVSHAQGIAINFECAPDECFQLHGERGLIVHANHWLSSVALSKLRDTGVDTMPDSLYRDLRVRQLLEPHRGAIDVGRVKAALFDRFAGEWAVCRPPRANTVGTLTASVAMIVMQPALGRIEVAMLPALQSSFATYSLDSMNFQRI
jgi:isopenicillin-N N-acyltransferase-like protein